MTRPNESVIKIVHVMDVDGVAITGLTLSDFTITAYADGVTWTHGSTITELANGFYKWTYTTAPTRAQNFIQIRPSNTSYYASFSAFRGIAWVGEVEVQDLDSLYARQARPVVRLASNGALGTQQPVTMYKDRWRLLEFEIFDEDNEPVALDSDYDNWQVAVRSKDQSTTVWDGTGATITPSDDGLLQIEVPENASFFDALDEGEDQTVLYWEVTADVGGVSTKTIAVIPSSQLMLKRSEVGS